MGGLYSVDPRVLSLSSPQLPTSSQLVALPLYFEYPSQETPESSWTFNRGPWGLHGWEAVVSLPCSYPTCSELYLCSNI